MVHGPDLLEDALKRLITHHHHSTLHHNHTSWWWFPPPIVLHPHWWWSSPPLYTYPTFEAKFKGVQCSLQTNWKRHELRWRLIGSAGRKPTSNEKLWICRSTCFFCLSGMTYLRRPFEMRLNVWDRDGMHTSRWKQRWQYCHTLLKAQGTGHQSISPLLSIWIPACQRVW